MLVEAWPALLPCLGSVGRRLTYRPINVRSWQDGGTAQRWAETGGKRETRQVHKCQRVPGHARQQKRSGSGYRFGEGRLSMAGPTQDATQAATRQGLFLIGGIVKETITTPSPSAVRDHLSSLLQVKNLVVLLGSGASFHLGSPRTRDLTNDQVLALIAGVPGDAESTSDAELLATINPNDSGDLEHLLNGLQLATSLAAQAGLDTVVLGAGDAARSYPKAAVERLRRSINRALAEACRLPSPSHQLEPPFDEDPLLAHRTFLARVLRNRRSNLPRPRIFTTNYDLVIEQALDELGFPYIDGFSGTVDRRLNLAFYGLDFHRVETTSQSIIGSPD